MGFGGLIVRLIAVNHKVKFSLRLVKHHAMKIQEEWKYNSTNSYPLY
jgi:hypothetical protein